MKAATAPDRLPVPSIISYLRPQNRKAPGSKNFRSPPQKDFCNNIGTFET
jgi:hypothetical protein